MVCEYCYEENETVKTRPDPYAKEIDSDYTEHNICDQCYTNRSQDI